MELTEKQKGILNSLISEFNEVNAKMNPSEENIFLPILDEVRKDKAKIQELKAIKKSYQKALEQIVVTDYVKYRGQFEEVGLSLTINPNNSYSMILDSIGQHNSNAIKFEYMLETDSTIHLLGEPIFMPKKDYFIKLFKVKRKV